MQLPQFQAHADMEERHWWFLARRQILQTLLHALLPPDDRAHGRALLIDVGCGTGGLTKFFSKDYSVAGVDPSVDAIRFAKEKFPDCSFIHGKAPEDVPHFASADAILLIEVLEHVEQDREFVHALIQKMGSGAMLIMMAPADSSLWSPHDAAFEHFRRYDSLAEFRMLWKEQPVRELLASFMNSRLHPLVKIMRFLSAKRGKSWGKGGTDISVPLGPVNALLRSIFAGEAGHLLRVMKGEARSYAKGVSVVAILQKI